MDRTPQDTEAFMSLRGLVLGLALVMPGCCTVTLWDWASGSRFDHDPAASIEQVEAMPDGGFRVRVRMTDGSESERRWPPDDADSPEAAFAAAVAAIGSDEQLRGLERAVRRGLQRRDFARAFPALAGRPELERLERVPVAPPNLSLRPLHGGTSETAVPIVLLAPPEPAVVVLSVEPVCSEVSHIHTYLVAVVTTPLAVMADVVTSPFQLVFLSLFSGLGRL